MCGIGLYLGIKYYNSAVRSVLCATKDASGWKDPSWDIRSGLLFFFVFVSFFSESRFAWKFLLVRGIRIMHIDNCNMEIYGRVNFIFLCPTGATSISRELRHTAAGAANTQPKPWLKISLILRLFIFRTRIVRFSRVDDTILSKGSSINSERK